MTPTTPLLVLDQTPLLRAPYYRDWERRGHSVDVVTHPTAAARRVLHPAPPSLLLVPRWLVELGGDTDLPARLERWFFARDPQTAGRIVGWSTTSVPGLPDPPLVILAPQITPASLERAGTDLQHALQTIRTRRQRLKDTTPS